MNVLTLLSHSRPECRQKQDLTEKICGIASNSRRLLLNNLSIVGPTSKVSARFDRLLSEDPLVRIAIIGAGIAGLSAAYDLSPQHEVTILEAGDYIGGHTHTVDVTWEGERHAIDTGFIVFNDRTYPHFVELLGELDVESQPTSMSFSVRSPSEGWEYSGSSLNGLFAQRRNLLRPGFYRMLFDIFRFNRSARSELALDVDRPTCTTTVGEFLDRGGYSPEFVDNYLLPMGSAIWSCPRGTFRDFPIQFIVEFFDNHGLLSLYDRPTWHVVSGGSRTYVQALLNRLRATVHRSTRVERVRRFADRVEISAANIGTQEFDHVILACHANQALALLDDKTTAEREILTAFPYERSVATLHTDTSLLPRSRRAWASWNYHLSDDSNSGATLTYCMNILQNLQSQHTFCVSLNSERRIAPQKVIAQLVYEHPIFTTQRTVAQARHSELCNANRTSYCGAYWGNGFHEDGVVSAKAVCKAINSCEPVQRQREMLWA